MSTVLINADITIYLSGGSVVALNNFQPEAQAIKNPGTFTEVFYSELLSHITSHLQNSRDIRKDYREVNDKPADSSPVNSCKAAL